MINRACKKGALLALAPVLWFSANSLPGQSHIASTSFDSTKTLASEYDVDTLVLTENNGPQPSSLNLLKTLSKGAGNLSRYKREFIEIDKLGKGS